MSEPLQFESAEPTSQEAPKALQCIFCKRAIAQQYFEINGRIACDRCHAGLQADLATKKPSRFFKAAALGLGAGAVGAGLYYAVAATTGYEFGLIGVVVGFLVGKAVRKGSENRGGRPYQVLAAAITYVAIVSTYVPFVFKAMHEKHAKEVAATTAKPVTPPATPTVGAAGEAPGQATAAPSPAAPSAKPEPISAGKAIGALFLLAGLLLAIPFLGGLSNIMGLAILGFSLFEAWKLNRRAPLSIQGPFSVGGGV